MWRGPTGPSPAEPLYAWPTGYADRVTDSELCPFAGTVIAIARGADDRVGAGEALIVLEAMKMEHELVAEAGGVVRRVEVEVGETVAGGAAAGRDRPRAERRRAPPATTAGPSPARSERTSRRSSRATSWASTRLARKRSPSGTSRAAARRGRTSTTSSTRASFVEYGPLIFAAQERRRAKDELIRRTPADGLVAGVGEIDGRPAVVMSYDYTVLAGTQGMRNHLKKDRLFELAERRRLPVVLFAEGGGGRPGDVDWPHVAGLDCRAFGLFAELSGLVPLVGIASGYCFAGNAALLGCCDVVIATEDSSIGMGGPAMIEGGGLGAFDPEEVGPIDVQGRQRRRRPPGRRTTPRRSRPRSAT